MSMDIDTEADTKNVAGSLVAHITIYYYLVL